MDTLHFKNAQLMREKLNSVSPSLCLAKWKQVTIHLHNGTTHSCHHPDVHTIPLSELKENPSALHNTSFKKQLRKMMLEGKRPRECDYCWNVEDSGEHLSDRHLKSSEYWAAPHFNNVVNQPWDANVLPSYVEVSFSTNCNFKCSYCSPKISSRWMQEIKEHGPYKRGHMVGYHSLALMKARGLMPIEDEETNPYIEAFWKWWPELYPALATFRITGGEPLLSPNTFRILDWIDQHPRPDMNLAINTNLGIPDGVLNRFLGKTASVCADKKVRNLTIYTSADTVGEHAEYLRFGMNYEKWMQNLEKVLARLPQARVVIMCTFNNLSVARYQEFLETCLQLRLRYGLRFGLDIAYLQNPRWQSVQILTPPHLAKLQGFLKFMEANSKPRGFFDFEIEKMRRLIAWANVPQDPVQLEKERQNFYLFFSQHDERRGTNFLKTFPEMADFWKLCRNLTERPKATLFLSRVKGLASDVKLFLGRH